MIVNLEPIGSGGTHWVALYSPKPLYVFFFDSLGNPPNTCLTTYLSKNFQFITRNKLRYQPSGSKLCGLYCAVFLYIMCKNSNSPIDTFEKFLISLSKQNNIDLYIERFVHRNML